MCDLVHQDLPLWYFIPCLTHLTALKLDSNLHFVDVEGNTEGSSEVRA